MFKKGDIVVKTITSGIVSRHGGKKGDVWEINKLTKFTKNSAYYQDGQIHSAKVRKATNNEIKWFEAGITNINQIPEVGNNFWYLGAVKTISTITKHVVFCDEDWSHFKFKEYLQIVKDINIHNKPPTKSTVDRDIMFSKPFEISDLKNCKIGNLTPEDHKIIQPWLFSLGYKWASGSHLTKIDQPYLCTTRDNYIFKKSNVTDFNRLQRALIKKELILNYIKQLNTNNNYEQINKRTKIKPESSTIRGASIRIPVITGRIASASRLIGNKASGKCIKSQIRKFEIVANIITC
jgi:hypothetical protein